MRFPLLLLIVLLIIPSKRADALATNVFNTWAASNSAFSTMLSNHPVISAKMDTNYFRANVLSFGAAADGATADDAAFSNALASARHVYAPRGTYRLTRPIMLGSGQTIFGDGRSTVLFIDADTNAIQFSNYTYYAEVRDLQISGSFAGTNTNQAGIYVSAHAGHFKISGVTMTNVYTGIHVQQNASQHWPSQIDTPYIEGSYNGIVTEALAEYISITSPLIFNCTNGLVLTAGNTTINGGAIVDCTTNVIIKAGVNDSHGTISGMLLNHASTSGRGLVIENISHGFQFVGCWFFNNVYDLQGTNIQFSTCTFGQSPLTFNLTNVVGLRMDNCTFKDVAFPTINASNSTYVINYFERSSGKVVQHSSTNNPAFVIRGASPFLEFGNESGTRLGYLFANASTGKMVSRSDQANGWQWLNSAGTEVAAMTGGGTLTVKQASSNAVISLSGTSPYLEFVDTNGTRLGYVFANTSNGKMVSRNDQTNGFQWLSTEGTEIASLSSNGTYTAAVDVLGGSVSLTNLDALITLLNGATNWTFTATPTNSTAGHFEKSGTAVTFHYPTNFAGGSGSQTPIVQDVDVGGYSYTNAGTIQTTNLNAQNISGTSAGGPKVLLNGALSTDDTWSGNAITNLNAGETIAQWDLVRVHSDGEWHLADADAAGEFPAIGMTVSAGDDTDAVVVLMQGTVRNDAWAWTVGGSLYLSATAGGLTQTAPTTSTHAVQRVGVALSADLVYLNFSGEWGVNE